MKKKIFISNIIFFIFIFLYISYGLNWGLPSNERSLNLFGDRDNLLKQSESLARTYNLEKKITNNKIYIDNYLKYQTDQTYEVSTSLALSRFLVVPYAGDDAFLLKALKNMDPKNLDFDPNYYMYGGGFIYTSAAILKFLEIISIVKLKNDILFYLTNPEEMGKIYLYLRYIVVFSFLLGLVMFFKFTKSITDTKHAYLSVFILIINPEVIASTHAVEPHAFVFPLFIIAIIFAKKYFDNLNNISLIIYAFFTGLSIGTQATSIYLILPFFYIQYVNYRKLLDLKKIFKNFLKFSSISLLSFLILNPYYILNFYGMVGDLLVGFDNLLVFKESNSSILNKFWAPFQISLFLVILFFSSIFYCYFFILNKYKDFLIILIIPAIIIYLILGGIMQYIFSALAIFSILSSLMIFDFLKRLNFTFKIICISLFSIFFLVSPITRSFYYLINYNYDNRLISGNWINKNVNKNMKISLSFPPTNWNSLPFNYGNYTLLDRDSALDADYVVLVNEKLDNKFKKKFTLKIDFPPKSIFGYRPVLKGEVHAIHAKYINIYKKN